MVQILVTGFGAIEESNRSQTALIARQHAVGSGVIVSSDGYIITNAHVVEGAHRIRVVLPMPSVDFPQVEPVGKEHIVDAKLIGIHKESDLALLKIEQKNLPILELGSARRVHQGQLVFAIGSPEGLQNSVTMGVVSAVGRQPDVRKETIETVDTIVCAAREAGFKDAFLDKSAWWAIRISPSLIPQLKWIAMYESRPVQAIRWIGKIQENGIKPYKSTGKYIIAVEQKTQIDPIKLDSNKRGVAPQSPRYTTYAKLRNAKSLSDLW